MILGGNPASSCSPTLSIEDSKHPARTGQDVTIKCRICDKKYIFWFKDGERLDETDRIRWFPANLVSFFPRVVFEGKLKIKKLTKNDHGVYTCYALDFFTSIIEQGDIKLAGKWSRI